MDCKTILVHIDQSDRMLDCIEFAARVANVQQAHLVGITQTGIAAFIRQMAVPGAELGDLTPLFEQLRDDAQQRAAQFDALVRQAGVASFEHRVGDDDPGNALATQAMYADLVIVSQRDPAHHQAEASVTDYVVLNAPCAVMVRPCSGSSAGAFERVLLAWNASPQAARAVRQALPFLVRAREVEVAILDDDHSGSQRAAAGGPDLASFLARHGVSVHIRQQSTHGDAADTLLALANTLGTELLVMGCYGHSRFRELLLGGVSRTILRRMNLPALMAH
jgi:nucleotide-binding universal stress UspA family protein